LIQRWEGRQGWKVMVEVGGDELVEKNYYRKCEIAEIK
jgi:hypothetical protein